MKLGQLVPSPEASKPFEYRFLRSLPTAPGCYALSNASGDILYVGQAVSLQDRLLQHWEAGKHNISTPAGRITRVSVVLVHEIAALNAHERGWINQCELADGSRPALNKVSGPV